MRDRNSNLGGASFTALAYERVRARRRAAFDGPGRRIAEPRDKARDKARAEREAEATTWIETVKARRR
jgi:hypothetical protein